MKELLKAAILSNQTRAVRSNLNYLQDIKRLETSLTVRIFLGNNAFSSLIFSYKMTEQTLNSELDDVRMTTNLRSILTTRQRRPQCIVLNCIHFYFLLVNYKDKRRVLSRQTNILRGKVLTQVTKMYSETFEFKQCDVKLFELRSYNSADIHSQVL